MKVKRVIRLSVFRAVVCAVFFAAQNCAAQLVKVETDKSSYALQEKITITLTNELPCSIFSTAASNSPDFAISNFERKLSQWSWDAYRLHCGWPECDMDFDAPGEIRSGQVVRFSWKPRIYADKKYKEPQPGLYRLTLIYQVRKEATSRNWTWRTVKSNEFTLQ